MKETERLILEAVQSGDHITLEEMRDYVWKWGKDHPNASSIGQFMANLRRAGKIVYANGVISLPAPQESKIVPANPERETVTLAPFFTKRSGRAVSIEQSPMMIHDVARIEVRVENTWVPILLQGDLRICLGPEVPAWHPAQETLPNATRLRIIDKSGRSEELNLSPGNPLTLAPKD